MNKHQFLKCTKCTKTKRRGRTGGSTTCMNVQPGYVCGSCARGGKRSRRKKVNK